jgi:hypothetical protein
MFNLEDDNFIKKSDNDMMKDFIEQVSFEGSEDDWRKNPIWDDENDDEVEEDLEDDDNSEDNNSDDELTELDSEEAEEPIKKSKEYLTQGEQTPHGEPIQTGSKGGKYFESIGNSPRQGEVPVIGLEVNAVPELKETVQKFQQAISETLSQLPTAHTKDIRFYLVNDDDLDDEGCPVPGQYAPVGDIISISASADRIPEEEIQKYYTNKMPGTSKTWRLVVLHELGHRVMSILGNTQFEWRKYAKENPSDGVFSSNINFKERFAESYLCYIQNPKYLEEVDKAAFDFLKSKVFNDKIFTEPIVK